MTASKGQHLNSTWVLVATLAIQSLSSMALITLPVMAPVVGDSIGVSPAFIGFYVAAVYVAAMFASILGGVAVKRWGALGLSQFCLITTSAGLLMCAIAHPITIVMGAMLIGLGYGPITPASSHLLIQSTPPERLSLVFSIKQTGVPVGGMLAGLVLPRVEGWFGWQVATISVAMACLLCALMVKPLRQALDHDRDPTARASIMTSLVQPIKLVWQHKSLRILAIVSFMFSVAQVSLTTYLVTFLYEDLGWGLVAAGVALTVVQGAGVTGRILWGWLADTWLGSSKMLMVIAVGLGVSAVATGALTANTPQAYLFVVLAVLGATAVGWNGVYLAEVARQAPKGMAGMATGGTLGFTFMGVLFGPPLFGLVAATVHSYGLSFTLLIVPACIVIVLLWTNRHIWKAKQVA
jgi:MFS family permease